MVYAINFTKVTTFSKKRNSRREKLKIDSLNTPRCRYLSSCPKYDISALW